MILKTTSSESTLQIWPWRAYSRQSKKGTSYRFNRSRPKYKHSLTLDLFTRSRHSPNRLNITRPISPLITCQYSYQTSHNLHTGPLWSILQGITFLFSKYSRQLTASCTPKWVFYTGISLMRIPSHSFSIIILNWRSIVLSVTSRSTQKMTCIR